MGWLDRSLLYSIHQLNHSNGWLRFIDNIEMKWVYGRENLNYSITISNSFHYFIKFTVEIFTSKNTFLYTTTSLINGKLGSV